MLIDTHCHLTLGELEHQSDEAWSRAREAGVAQAVVVGIDRATSQRVADHVRDRDGLFGTVGIHPNSTREVQPGDFEEIRRLGAEPKVVALGETGMDLYRRHSDAQTQRLSLLRHAELALEVDLPLVLHIRDAYREAAEALESFAGRGGRAVVHCFTGGPDDLQPYVEWGFCISFSGVVTFPSAPLVQQAACQVPIGQCLVETDAPWLAPAPHRGKTNEPAFVVHTARHLAELHRVSFEEMSAATTANARRLFRLPPPGG